MSDQAGQLTAFILRWVLSVLAAYRVAYLFTLDTGPFAIFARIREWVLRRWGGESWQYDGATCPLCQSVWYTFIAALFFPWRGFDWFVLTWLSMAAACLIIHIRVYIK